MFQRTINSQYQIQECTRPKPRRLLNSETDTKEVYFEHVQDAPDFKQKQDRKEPGAEEASVPVSVSTGKAEMAPVSVSVPVSVTTAKAVQTELEDEGVKARDIVKMIVSRVLKKASSDVDGTKSIKALAGGRSTIQCSSSISPRTD
jgi:fatty acid synthase subunit alpha